LVARESLFSETPGFSSHRPASHFIFDQEIDPATQSSQHLAIFAVTISAPLADSMEQIYIAKRITATGLLYIIPESGRAACPMYLKLPVLGPAGAL